MPLKLDAIEEPNLNLTPMIDIVFLLIIFFMMGARFSEIEQKKFDVEVPRVAAAMPLTSLPDERVIYVQPEGGVLLDGDPVSLEELKQELEAARERYANQAVVIRGDRTVTYQTIADVLTVCHEARIRSVSLATRLQREGD